MPMQKQSSDCYCASRVSNTSRTTLGAPNLSILNNLLKYICKCAQTHKSTISKKMNLLYVAVEPSLYTHYSAGEVSTRHVSIP